MLNSSITASLHSLVCLICECLFNMRLPTRIDVATPTDSLNLAKFRTLHFSEMDFERYPCLRMAFESGRAGQSAPTVFNAANEIAVARFLGGQISFLDIERIIESVLNRHQIVRCSRRGASLKSMLGQEKKHHRSNRTVLLYRTGE